MAPTHLNLQNNNINNNNILWIVAAISYHIHGPRETLTWGIIANDKQVTILDTFTSLAAESFTSLSDCGHLSPTDVLPWKLESYVTVWKGQPSWSQASIQNLFPSSQPQVCLKWRDEMLLLPPSVRTLNKAAPFPSNCSHLFRLHLKLKVERVLKPTLQTIAQTYGYVVVIERKPR